MKLFSNKEEIRRAIMAADDIHTEEIEVPEWGGKFLVRALTGTQRDAYENSMMSIKKGDLKTDMRNRRVKLVALCLVDEHGKRVFGSESEIADLGGKSSAAINRVYEAAARLSGIREEDVENAEENFDLGQSSEDSTSD